MTSARRPLRTRDSRWAGGLSRALLRLGLRPNQVSVLSVVFAAGAAVALVFLSRGAGPAWLLWILAAVGIQLRLLCNLMDGMLAVEGGLKTPDGDLYNEFPDRLSDPLLLAALGYAGGDDTTRLLGWLCAIGALLTAAIRLHGATLTGQHDFRGPMAKPQRMALATGACLLMAGLDLAGGAAKEIAPLPWILGLLLAGIVVTIVRRLVALSRLLHGRARS
ncbi:MAG: CDP-alcohol phosphatidyltransferase family protein [Verrucomicrobiales bacterium]|nr:CDP-alcohol phosphatidyltransferase family protein [Verrucomicrobiales bacterium]